MRSRTTFSNMRKRKSTGDLVTQVSLQRRRPKVKLDVENGTTPTGKIFDYTFDDTFE